MAPQQARRNFPLAEKSVRFHQGCNEPAQPAQERWPPRNAQSLPWPDPSIQYCIMHGEHMHLSLIHISEPTRQAEISYAVFCLKKKKTKKGRGKSDLCFIYNSERKKIRRFSYGEF